MPANFSRRQPNPTKECGEEIYGQGPGSFLRLEQRLPSLLISNLSLPYLTAFRRRGRRDKI